MGKGEFIDWNRGGGGLFWHRTTAASFSIGQKRKFGTRKKNAVLTFRSIEEAGQRVAHDHGQQGARHLQAEQLASEPALVARPEPGQPHVDQRQVGAAVHRRT